MIAEEIGRFHVKHEEKLSELEIDSLDFLSIVTRLESVTEMEVPKELLTRFETAGDLADWFARIPCRV